jgi:hypothetical protein
VEAKSTGGQCSCRAVAPSDDDDDDDDNLHSRITHSVTRIHKNTNISLFSQVSYTTMYAFRL